MQKFDEWYFPDGESHMPSWMQNVNRRVNGRLTYQYGKYEVALTYTAQRRVALDIGAHVGLWSWFMARDFRNVAAFEPVQEHRACWHKNLIDRPNAELFGVALGETDGMVALSSPTVGSTGDCQISGDGKIPLCRLDDSNLFDVDFIKVDCEGYELKALRGAEQTLLACRPVVVVEQKGNMIEKYGGEKLDAVRYLESLGAILHQEMAGDFIMSWSK